MSINSGFIQTWISFPNKYNAIKVVKGSKIMKHLVNNITKALQPDFIRNKIQNVQKVPMG